MEHSSSEFETRHLNLPEGEELNPVRVTTGSLDEALPWVIEFRIVGTAATIQAQVHEAMIIGRGDPQSGVYPAVDLGPHSAFHLGVSRQHAVVLAKDNRIKIKDLGSVNGTRLNGFQLVAGQEYRLRHGDELEIGQVKLQVRFAVVPTSEGSSDQPGSGYATIPIIGNGERILIVEDDSDVGKVFKLALQHAGFNITVLENATSALGHFSQQLPDLLITDLMLPDMSGVELIRFLRKQPGGEHVPVLVCSGAVGGYQMNQAKELGVEYFLTKPVSVDDLLNTARTALNKHPAEGAKS
ncbi:MAG: response regulator [Anaerolineae bacterium]|nr:response regulator [Anaerolineae bacterium]